jgi:hypothetical protein
MASYPTLIPAFSFREPEEKADAKLLSDVHEHGWHVVGVPDDEEGPGFAFTVGVYLRTLQPEILIMGLPMETAHRLLNSIADHFMNGGRIVAGRRNGKIIEGLDLMFKVIHSTQFHEYLGCANWFYKHLGKPFPAYQCFWPDSQGRFPDESAFEERFKARQIDLSIRRRSKP